MSEVLVRPANVADSEAIAAIYNHYILHTVVSFEEEAVDGAEVARRMQAVGDASLPWLVGVNEGAVVGYAYAGKWNGRCAYKLSVEITVYLDHAHVGRGVGSRLYDALFAELRRKGLHTVIGGIALPNDASVALHEKCGLQRVALFKEVGFKFDRWIDVGYWQRLL